MTNDLTVASSTLLGLNKGQWFGLIRTLFMIACTWLVSSGVLTNEQMGHVASLSLQAAPVGAIVGTMIWGIVARSDKNLSKAVGAIPGVEVVVDTDRAPAGVSAAALNGAFGVTAKPQ